MTGPGRVVVVGSVNIDLVVRVARLPEPGETVVGGRFEQHHGGKGGNQAVAAARMGVPTWLIGAVGGDAFGAEARTALTDGAVDIGELATLDAAATGVAFILVDDAGENCIAVASGANALVTPGLVRAALDRLTLTSADVVLVSHEIPTAAAAAALGAGRRAGATTILNPAPATGLDVATVALADIVTPNEVELDALRSAAIDPPTVLISRGPLGAELVTARGSSSLPAPSVVAVDTVGAGDTLNGVLAAGLAEGRSLEEAATRAVVAASLAVTRAGAREGIPTRGELDAAVGRSAG